MFWKLMIINLLKCIGDGDVGIGKLGNVGIRRCGDWEM